MKNLSIHDNLLIGYEVLCDRREIILHTSFHDRKRTEHTDIVFFGVEAYHFIGDNMQTILFDVTEATTDHIFHEFTAEFEDGKKYCWPGAWNDSLEACQKHFQQEQCKAWTISSSYGGGGFVIAKRMEFKQVR